jgi:hypothetical protein
MALEPAPGGEVGSDTRGQQREADAESAEDPAHLYAALEHETVKESQNEDEHGGFRKEGGAAMRGDGDEVDESRGALFRSASAACGRGEDQAQARGGWLNWLLERDAFMSRNCTGGTAPDGSYYIFVKHKNPCIACL